VREVVVRTAGDAVGADGQSDGGLYRTQCGQLVSIEDGVPVPALKGWTQSSGVDLWTALDRYPKGLFKHLLVTDVGRDGAMTGPNLELLAEIRRRRPDLVLQASGGVSSLDDIAAVKSLGCNGAIVGRALYENRFTLPDAIATAA
jgi:phosphoribosylformimino-5-aminoimidazole carboxamide ribotide isomerase